MALDVAPDHLTKGHGHHGLEDVALTMSGAVVETPFRFFVGELNLKATFACSGFLVQCLRSSRDSGEPCVSMIWLPGPMSIGGAFLAFLSS